MSITFSSPVQSFGGYFTYAESLTLDAFGIGNTLLASMTSPFSNNEAHSGVPGSSPNELLQVSSLSGISRVTIMGDPVGGSFVLDDATYTVAVTGVPEPGTLWLMLPLMGPLVFLRLAMRFSWGRRLVTGAVALVLGVVPAMFAAPKVGPVVATFVSEPSLQITGSSQFSAPLLVRWNVLQQMPLSFTSRSLFSGSLRTTHVPGFFEN
jgi:hypothetical protein